MGVIRRAVVSVPLRTLAAALFCVLACSAAAEPITLRLHTFNSPQSIAVRLFLQPWAEEVEARSEGRVDVQVFPAMQLGGKASDLYGQARDGVVDIVWTLPGYSPGRFPLTEVFELPYVCADAEATSQALHEFYRTWLQGEYQDTHPLVFHATAPGHLHTADREVRTLEDLEGLKMRVPSRVSAEMLEALGAVPVGMPVPSVYEALSRGVVEGAWIPWTIMRPFRLHEVTRYHTEVSLSCALFLMTMNKARYDGLPAEVRAIIDETTGIELAKRLGRLWQDDEQPGRAIALERGHSIFPLAEAERERWRTVLQSVTDGWIEKVSAMGHDGEAMLADARRLVAKYGDDLHQ